jgi:hypothetical protein
MAIAYTVIAKIFSTACVEGAEFVWKPNLRAVYMYFSWSFGFSERTIYLLFSLLYIEKLKLYVHYS